MKNIIPFSKDLDFKTKVSEITSISLEREFSVSDLTIMGNLLVTGDFKNVLESVNTTPFSYKIPFTIEIPDNLDKDTLTLEISDFAYDIITDSVIKVNIELELTYDLCKEEEIDTEVLPEVDPDSVIAMIEERHEEENKEEDDDSILVSNIEEDLDEREEEEVVLESVNPLDEYQTYHIHIVKDGEAVETICTMYNSNLDMLANYNDITNVVPGVKLIIPSEDE